VLEWKPRLIVVLFVLIAGVFISTRHEATRAFLILSVAGYLVEYSGPLI